MPSKVTRDEHGNIYVSKINKDTLICDGDYASSDDVLEQAIAASLILYNQELTNPEDSEDPDEILFLLVEDAYGNLVHTKRYNDYLDKYGKPPDK